MYHRYFPYPYYPPLYHPQYDQRMLNYPHYGEYHYQPTQGQYERDQHQEYPYSNQYELEESNFHPLTESYDSDERQDFGSNPYVVNIEKATERNRAFVRAIWTGRHLQVTLMSIPPGEDIGLEVHRNSDQFLRIEEGRGFVQMGDRQDQLNFERRVSEDDAILIPAGKWHNIRNTGRGPLKLYSIYAPPEHQHGTIHRTKQDAMAAHEH